MAGMVCLALCVTSSAAFAADPVLEAGISGSTLTYQLRYSDAPTYFRLYLDTDRNGTSGFPQMGIGAEYLVENDALYRYTGVSGSWSWSYAGSSSYTNASGIAAWKIDSSAVGSPVAIDLIGQVEAPLLNSAKVTQQVAATPSSTGRVTYTPGTASFPSPERGFYRHTGDCDRDALQLGALQGDRANNHVTLVACVFYLREFVDAPISQAALDFFQRQMDTVRAAGMKAIVRFAYSDSAPGGDASPARVAAHLDQLAPYIKRNDDVVYVFQSGLIGAWGEWYYTTNYGTEGNLSSTNWADRKAVVDKLLKTVPARRMLQLRTPNYKRTMYGTTALSSSEAFKGSAKARIGHHNDCFLARYNDQGTYLDPAVEYPYLQAETAYLPMGGETCEANPPRSDCATALDELRHFHWSYLNADYHPDVLGQWRTEGCFEQIRQKLGYRFVLQDGTYSPSAKPGGAFSVAFALRNEGWAAPFNTRGVELILRNTSTAALHRFRLAADPRHWLPGQSVTVSQSLTLPADVAPGNYALSLNLYDPATGLRYRPDYAIRLANADLWEESTGFNRLLHTMTIAP